MRHVGQEFGLHPVRFLQFEVGALQHLDGLALALEAAGIVERHRGLVGEDLQHLHQGGIEGTQLMEVDRDGADELALEKHRQPEGGSPAVLLSERIQREAAVELDIFREHRPPLDHDLGHQPW